MVPLMQPQPQASATAQQPQSFATGPAPLSSSPMPEARASSWPIQMLMPGVPQGVQQSVLMPVPWAVSSDGRVFSGMSPSAPQAMQQVVPQGMQQSIPQAMTQA